MKDIELLAPAGGIEALQMAVMSGADAVYIGGKFSARSETAVFTTEEMKSAIDFCHLYGVKVHVAVNTLIKENEIDVLGEYIKELCEMGVDAVINKKLITASRIFKFTLSNKVRFIKYMSGTNAEVLEYIVAPDTKITKAALKDMDFPRNAIVGGVIRGNDSYIAVGDTRIEAYDRVAVFALPDAVKEVDKFFK